MQEIRQREFALGAPSLLVLGFVTTALATAALIGSFPLQASIVTIFLFAGVHNALEFRYFLARMPIRWGRSRLFYSVGIGGVVVLTAIYLSIYFGSGTWLWSAEGWQYAVSGWNTAFVLWVALLFYLRGRQKPRADWSWAFAAAFLIAAIVWFFPSEFAIALVYVHPFVALWFVDRQLRRSKPEWLGAYHLCLLTIPLFLFGLYALVGSAAPLSESTNLFERIVHHAGGGVIRGVSTHFLVASHVFLETIHYAAWIVLIPLADERARPWRVKSIPLFAGGGGFPKLVVSMLAVSLILVLALWFGFSADYATTRDIYFAFAIGHVLAEFPFLVKML